MDNKYKRNSAMVHMHIDGPSINWNHGRGSVQDNYYPKNQVLAVSGELRHSIR